MCPLPDRPRGHLQFAAGHQHPQQTMRYRQPKSWLSTPPLLSAGRSIDHGPTHQAQRGQREERWNVSEKPLREGLMVHGESSAIRSVGKKQKGNEQKMGGTIQKAVSSFYKNMLLLCPGFYGTPRTSSRTF